MTKTSAIFVALAGLAGLMGAGEASAQWHNSAQFDRDMRACDRRGVNFDRCMWERGWTRGNGQRWNHNQNWNHGQNWGRPPPNHWNSPPPNHWNSPPSRNQPRLSDMQQRALDNCFLLPPAEQPRCRATVMSTVRR